MTVYQLSSFNLANSGINKDQPGYSTCENTICSRATRCFRRKFNLSRTRVVKPISYLSLCSNSTLVKTRPQTGKFYLYSFFFFFFSCITRCRLVTYIFKHTFNKYSNLSFSLSLSLSLSLFSHPVEREEREGGGKRGGGVIQRAE